jgi:hypothetical protein
VLDLHVEVHAVNAAPLRTVSNFAAEMSLPASPPAHVFAVTPPAGA